MGKLPNLELLEYMAEQVIRGNEEAMKKIKKRYEESMPKAFRRKTIPVELSCEVFSQVWGSTCTAFDVMEDGGPAVGGSAMTSAYTTVFRESVSDTYVVFVDGRLCYLVEKPTKEFLKDLKHRNLKSLSEAKKDY